MLITTALNIITQLAIIWWIFYVLIVYNVTCTRLIILTTIRATMLVYIRVRLWVVQTARTHPHGGPRMTELGPDRPVGKKLSDVFSLLVFIFVSLFIALIHSLLLIFSLILSLSLFHTHTRMLIASFQHSTHGKLAAAPIAIFHLLFPSSFSAPLCLHVATTTHIRNSLCVM